MLKKDKKDKRIKTKRYEKRLAIKMLVCLVYLIVITILLVCTYKLHTEKKEILPWEQVVSTDEYTYIEISKMSEKFAYYETENIGIHFVIEEEDTGEWHTYLIAIDETKYDKYKNIIDYTYERTTTKPETIKVYGYPVIIDEKLKQMAINNIINFIPAENEVRITAENFEDYLTNSYLDTTKEKKEEFNTLLCIMLLLLFVMVGLLLFTIFDRDKIVDNIDEKIEKVTIKKKKLRLKILKKYKKK